MNPDQVIALLAVIANLQLQIIERDQRIAQMEEMMSKLVHPEPDAGSHMSGTAS